MARRNTEADRLIDVDHTGRRTQHGTRFESLDTQAGGGAIAERNAALRNGHFNPDCALKGRQLEKRLLDEPRPLWQSRLPV